DPQLARAVDAFAYSFLQVRFDIRMVMTEGGAEAEQALARAIKAANRDLARLERLALGGQQQSLVQARQIKTDHGKQQHRYEAGIRQIAQERQENVVQSNRLMGITQ